MSDTEEAPPMPVKVKKERTEKQKAAAQRMMEGLKEKRRQQAEDAERDFVAARELDKQERQKHEYEVYKQKQHKSKKLPPVPNYVTTAQLELMERRLLAALPKEVYREIPLKTEIVEKVVPVDVIHTVTKETIREKPTIVEKRMTGNELLDKIFFK